MRKERATVAVIDAGGRGSVLVQKYSESSQVERVIAIPGNDFMHVTSEKEVTTYQGLKTTSVEQILQVCKEEGVNLVDVAQDNAVAAGLVDQLTQAGISAIGPTKSAGEIGSNKAFSREFLLDLGIPQPEFKIFHSPESGIRYLNSSYDQAWFVKASGLAEGKGALPATNNYEAIDRIRELQRFGDASSTYLIEQWLTDENGQPAEEFSAFAISDGEEFKILGYAQDHKRAFDGDQGENTGGMGCSSPPLVVNQEIEDQVDNILSKTIGAMSDINRTYKGILYLGGMIVNEKGRQKVYVVGFNARWGDPEAQVLVPNIQNDLFELSEAVINKQLYQSDIRTDGKTRVVVAATAKGYPKDYSKVKGKIVYGLENAINVEGVKVYGGGIKKLNNNWVVNGGRVVYVVGEGENIIEAREKAYKAIRKINIEGDNLHYRTDIGARDIKRHVVYERT